MKPHEHVILEIARERERQMDGEGWTTGHDDCHDKAELSRAAMNYIGAATLAIMLDAKQFDAETSPPLNGLGLPFSWPWQRAWWKPGAVRRMLVKAAALIVAEIERIDRADAKRSAA